MQRRDVVAVARVDRGAAIEEYGGDARGAFAVGSSQIGDAMERGLAEAIAGGDVGAAIDEIADDIGVQRLRGVEQQRRAVLIHDRRRLPGHRGAIAEVDDVATDTIAPAPRSSSTMSRAPRRAA